jgi:hypothetical protein
MHNHFNNSLYFTIPIGAWLALTCASAQQLTGEGTSLSEEQVKKLNVCIELTYREMRTNSQSQCHTNERYYPADGGGSIRVKIRFNVPASYTFVPGTQSATHNGQCTHNVYANWRSETSFECEWEAAGCGLFKEGGHVRGFCTVAIRYVPQDGDMVRVKEYCLSSLFGGNTAKPTVTKVDCSLG